MPTQFGLLPSSIIASSLLTYSQLMAGSQGYAYNSSSDYIVWRPKTDISEFERVVRLGLGRAITVVQTVDPRPYHPAILHTALRDLAYDRQIEGSRAQYVFDLIRSSSDPAICRAQVLAALQTTTDEEQDNLYQLFELAQLFAREGDDEARAVMYARFAANAAGASLDFGSELTGAEEILDLDGVKGFLFVAEKLGERALIDHDFWDDGYLLRCTEEHADAEAVRSEIERARDENPKVAAYLRVVEETVRRAAEATRGRVNYAKFPYDELAPLIGNTSEKLPVLALRGWGQAADEETIARAASDLLKEAAPRRLLDYLRIFWKRPFPFGPEPLITYTRSTDNEVARAAFVALSNFQHPVVRSLAVGVLTSPDACDKDVAVDLLERNYETGDHKLIEGVLRTAHDEVPRHRIGFGALCVFETHPTPDCASTLVTLYENGPCSKCRERCFDLLHSLNVLPDWMIDECLHDSNMDLREKARSLRQHDVR